MIGAKGHPDLGKVQPFVWDPAQRTYHSLGALLGQAWQIGKKVSGTSK